MSRRARSCAIEHCTRRARLGKVVRADHEHPGLGKQLSAERMQCVRDNE